MMQPWESPPITGLPRLPSFPCALPHQYCPGDDGNFHHNVASITSPVCLLPSNIIGRMIAHFPRLLGWFLLLGIQPGGIRGPPSQWGLGSNPSQNMLGICADWVKLFRALSLLVYSLKTLSIVGLKIPGTGRNILMRKIMIGAFWLAHRVEYLQNISDNLFFFCL